MPSLPIYNSKQNITPNTAEPLRNEAAQPFQDDQKVLATMSDVTQKFGQAQDVMQYTEAKAKHGLAVADIEARASADPDFKNSEKYTQELSKVKANSLTGITNQQVAAKAGIEFDYDTKIAGIKIGAQFQQKQIKYNQVMVKSNLDSLMQNKLAAATPAEAQQYDLQIQQLLHANTQTGVLSYEEADKLLTDSQKTSVQYEIYNDPSTAEKDSEVLKQLRDPSGKYSFLPPDKRLDLIQESQRRIFQNNQTFKKEVETSQSARNTGFIDKLSTQTATFKDLDQEEKVPEEQGGIPRKVLLQYRRFLQTGVDKTLNDYMKEKVAPGSREASERSRMATEYNGLIENYIDDKTDQWKAKELVAKALADGHIDADEAKVLDPIKGNLKDIKFNKDTSPIAWAIKSVKGMMGASNASSEDIALKTKQLLGSIGEGGDPQVEATKIMDSEMLKHFPDYKTFPVKGKRYMDKRSSRANVVYPDGKWAWVDGSAK